MKYLFLLCLFVSVGCFAQPGTDVYLTTVEVSSKTINIGKPVNISSNPGYDNQPSFSPNGQYLYFSSTREGQTDIAQYELGTKEKSFINSTPGSEYSPTPIPGNEALSAIRLETDGRQLLYRYQIETGDSKVIIPYVKIGYHVWIDEHRMLAFVLGNPPTLQLIDMNAQTAEILSNSPGRALHQIPGSENLSYVDKSIEPWVITAYNPKTGNTAPLANVLGDVEDITWLNSQTLLSAQGNSLYAYVVGQSTDWQLVSTFENLRTITRLAVHPEGNQLALVARDEDAPLTPSELAQAQLIAYNNGDIDAFLAPYAADVEIYNFPETVGIQGKEAMRPRYKQLFESAPELNCQLVHREAYENYVIDHEYITGLPNGQTARATAIYFTENGKITKVYFIR